MTHQGQIVALHRHPIKGFTPESLSVATLTATSGLALDRAYAVENGPSGFDPLAPVHISKMRFIALAPVPRAAAIVTRLDEQTGLLEASAPLAPPIHVDLSLPADRQRFANWLTGVLGDEVAGPLKVVQAQGHRFLDDPFGQISLTNLSSLTALSEHMDRPVDPLRLRGNVQIAGWPPFAELRLAPGTRIRLGAVIASVVKPIRRCVATHVNPQTAERDMDVVSALQALTGRPDCGVYVRIETSGQVRPGDLAEMDA